MVVTERLFAWEDTTLIGLFEETAGQVTFRYDPNYSGAPISLSLPLTGEWDASLPSRFLQSKLPEDADGQLEMKIALGADSVSPFDLLPLTDAVGGVIFTKRAEAPDRGELLLEVCPQRQFENHVSQLSRHSGESWWPEDKPHARFSLAGAQGKFTLAQRGEKWLWPSGSVPSTHIFKPHSPRFPRSGLIENASMDLAGLTGADVAGHGLIQVRSETCYYVERFDRDVSAFPAKRLRTEELFYALSLEDDDKYRVEVRDVVERMRAAGLSDSVAYGWISQVMVNMSVGNCDAHMRNYSIFLDDHPRTTPLYDVLNTMCWPWLDDAFAIMVNEQCMACGDFTPRDWEEEAKVCNLDAELLVSEAVRIAQAAVEGVEVVAPALPEDLRDGFAHGVYNANRGMLGLKDIDPPVYIGPLTPGRDRLDLSDSAEISETPSTRGEGNVP